MTNVPPPETPPDDITLIVPMPPPSVAKEEVPVREKPAETPPTPAAEEGPAKGAE